MSGVVTLLREGRRRELEQALFYRFLSGDAEDAGDGATAERLNDLLADEQHPVSRLPARLLELGEKPGEDPVETPETPSLAGWEPAARAREADEVAWYEAAVSRADDPATRAILQGILESERQHLDHLAGKWMPAGPNEAKEQP